MKNTAFTTLLLTATLSACSNFEAADHSNPASATYSVEESTDYAMFDTSSGYDVELHEDALVMELTDLDVAVYEVESREQAEADPSWVGYDSKYPLSRIKDLEPDCQLWYELFNRRDLAVGYVGVAPANMLEMSEEIGHHVAGFQTDSDVIYDSEIIKGIIQSMEKDVDYLYLPFDASTLPDLVLKAIDYAKAEEIRVFDQRGHLL